VTRHTLAQVGASSDAVPAASAAASMVGGPASGPTRSAAPPFLQEQDALASPLPWQRWRNRLGLDRDLKGSPPRKGGL